MEAVWKIEVVDFPAFVIVDDKGNDFFRKWCAEYTPVEEDSSFDEARDMFFGLDADRSGGIDLQELASGLHITHLQAQTLLERFDVDQSGALDMKEFELLLFKNSDLIRK